MTLTRKHTSASPSYQRSDKPEIRRRLRFPICEYDFLDIQSSSTWPGLLETRIHKHLEKCRSNHRQWTSAEVSASCITTSKLQFCIPTNWHQERPHAHKSAPNTAIITNHLNNILHRWTPFPCSMNPPVSLCSERTHDRTFSAIFSGFAASVPPDFSKLQVAPGGYAH